jgi:flagellin-like protein
MNQRGVSAVVGVVLMIAITIAIAATVYYYVETMLDCQECQPDGLVGSHWVNGTGTLRGLKEVDCYAMTIGNFTFRPVDGITGNDVVVISAMLGQEVSYHLWWDQPRHRFELDSLSLAPEG